MTAAAPAALVAVAATVVEQQQQRAWQRTSSLIAMPRALISGSFSFLRCCCVPSNMTLASCAAGAQVGREPQGCAPDGWQRCNPCVDESVLRHPSPWYQEPLMACRGYPFWAPDEKALAQRERRAEVAAFAAKSRVAKAKPQVWHARSFTLVKSRQVTYMYIRLTGFSSFEIYVNPFPHPPYPHSSALCDSGSDSFVRSRPGLVS